MVMLRFLPIAAIALLLACQAPIHSMLPAVEPLGLDDPVSSPLSKSLLVGISPAKFIGFEEGLREQLLELDNWSGQRHSLVGLFVSLESANPMHDIPAQLRLLAQYGYTPFINLTSGRSAREVAEGKIDRKIYALALAFLEGLKIKPQQKIILAPLPEMNGFWESYGETPVYFKQAYNRIRTIFSKAGVNDNNVYWSFAPNGWARPGHQYRDYYPGDDKVDILSYSSYNFGFCGASQWPKWQEAKQLHSEYLESLSALAEDKPIIVAQMASTAITSKGYSLDAKGSWLKNNYALLESNPRVAGVIYFNIDKECDWAIYQGRHRGLDSYRESLQLKGITYVSPHQIGKFFKQFGVIKNDNKHN